MLVLKNGDYYGFFKSVLANGGKAIVSKDGASVGRYSYLFVRLSILKRYKLFTYRREKKVK